MPGIHLHVGGWAKIYAVDPSLPDQCGLVPRVRPTSSAALAERRKEFSMHDGRHRSIASLVDPGRQQATARKRVSPCTTDEVAFATPTPGD